MNMAKARMAKISGTRAMVARVTGGLEARSGSGVLVPARRRGVEVAGRGSCRGTAGPPARARCCAARRAKLRLLVDGRPS